MAEPHTISLGVGPDLHLALVRFGDGWRLRVQVGDDEVADVHADLAALREFVHSTPEETPMSEPSASANVGTVRTTVNTTILAAIAGLAAKIFEVKVEAEDLLPYVVIAAPVIAVFYRLSRAITDRWPQIGYVLFGNARPPAYPLEPPAPAPPPP